MTVFHRNDRDDRDGRPFTLVVFPSGDLPRDP